MRLFSQLRKAFLQERVLLLQLLYDLRHLGGLGLNKILLIYRSVNLLIC